MEVVNSTRDETRFISSINRIFVITASRKTIRAFDCLEMESKVGLDIGSRRCVVVEVKRYYHVKTQVKLAVSVSLFLHLMTFRFQRANIAFYSPVREKDYS